ncbi:unnamed protein product [Cryptosporidium hominis]|uniref:Nucleolus and neural progenitor protein-like N-terminal domain-containing protein n=1 Tax=Cryptosporidium hominis TaxID=237895 RepID=A0A0S4TFE4_CRYHO|nr:hypothetical protein [Cryptosporidium hominis TU502]OLQ17241.1 hypothetical protein ChTU502y2012_403g0055 [Cryptosporidium hominis]PPA65048.1 hypothetical protein ChUKH1_16185 [Cryptosporidium hominis]CUV05395.1 unnamed protein product [Cryptosporidium hominis]
MEKINYYCKALSQELKLLERVIYKFKNQHGRLGYFKSIFRITKELKLFYIALQETFYNNKSTENAENYYKNLKDLSKIVRRIKWDLKDAGTSISRLLSHGFFLPLVFLLFSILSRIFSVIINIKVTIDHIIPTIPFKSSHSNQSSSISINSHKNNKISSNFINKTSESLQMRYFDEEVEDLGEVVSWSSIVEKSDIPLKSKNTTSLIISNDNNSLEPEMDVKNSFIDLISEQVAEKEICSSNGLQNDATIHNENVDQDLAIQSTATNTNASIKLIRAWNSHMILRSKRRKLTN